MIWLELGLVAFVLAAAVLIALSRDVVGATVTFAAFSLGLAVVWVLLAAPDVALVEAAVGAGVMSVLLLVAVIETDCLQSDDDEEGERRFRPVNWPLVAVLSVLALPFGWTTLSLPPFGSPDAPAVRETYPDGGLTPYGYYIEATLVDAGFSNAVVAVLVVFRGLDTFGELVVAFAAAASVLVVLDRTVIP